MTKRLLSKTEIAASINDLGISEPSKRSLLWIMRWYRYPRPPFIAAYVLGLALMALGLFGYLHELTVIASNHIQDTYERGDMAQIAMALYPTLIGLIIASASKGVLKKRRLSHALIELTISSQIYLKLIGGNRRL